MFLHLACAWREIVTIAVCIKCGAIKFGAFTDCGHCSQSPASAKELANSILLSDHYYSMKELKEIGIEIANTGRLPIFAERRQTEMIATLENSPYLDILLGRSAPKCNEPDVNSDRDQRSTYFSRISKTVSRFFRKNL
jgi:hypothetical protein